MNLNHTLKIGLIKINFLGGIQNQNVNIGLIRFIFLKIYRHKKFNGVVNFNH